MKQLHVTEWCHHFLREQVKAGDFCIDATMGRGMDTEYLCALTGAEGRVLAFDIQEEALKQTKSRLQKAGYQNYYLIQDSHANMKEYAKPGSAACIVFNLGYLPGGDHQIATEAGTTIQALTQGLELLQHGGLISLCIYSGGDSGYEERDRVMAWLKTLDEKEYLVVVSAYYNRKNDPPIPVLIIKR